MPAGSTHPSRLRRLLSRGLLDVHAAPGDFQAMHERDARGDPWHWLLAALWALCVVAPMSVAEFAVIPLAVVWCARCFYVPRAMTLGLRLPTFLVLLLWGAYHAISLLWTRDLRIGVEQVGVLRFALAIVLIFPALEKRGLLIGAMALGFLAGNVSQVTEWIGERWQIAWLAPWHFVGRNGGWWGPAYGGELMVAALGLHLPAAAMGRGAARGVAIAGVLVTLAGMLATGTRAAWFAAVMLGVCVLVVAASRAGARRGRIVLAGLVVFAAVGAGAWLVAGESIAARVSQARREIGAAIVEHRYEGDDATRLAMARWAMDAIAERPILGMGAGGYSGYVRETKRGEGRAYEEFVRAGHGHCHNAVLQAWACGGLVGLGLTALVLVVVAGSCVRTLTRETLGMYAAGPAFALLGMLFLVPFDAIQANATTGKVLLGLVALCPAWLPRRGVERVR